VKKVIGLGLVLLAVLLFVLAAICFIGAIVSLILWKPLTAIALFVGAAILVILSILTGAVWIFWELESVLS